MMKTIPKKYIIVWLAGFAVLAAGIAFPESPHSLTHRIFLILVGLYAAGGCYCVLRFVAPVKPWLKVLLYFLMFLNLLGVLTMSVALVVSMM